MNGKRQEVQVTRYLAYDHLDNIGFAMAEQDRYWVAYLEKAWAKAHGSYSAIEEGRAAETFRDLTGAPTFHYNMKEIDNSEELIRQAMEREWLVTCRSKSTYNYCAVLAVSEVE